MSIKIIKNIEEFEALTKRENKIYFIKFATEWCGYCKIMNPIFKELSMEEEVKSKVVFAEINRDENRDLIQKYGFEIPTIPRFFVVKFTADGEFTAKNNILSKLGGSQSKDQLRDGILAAIGEKEELTKSVNQTKQSDSDNSPKKVAIIGSGPSGLTAAIYTSRAQLDTTVYLGMEPGGQLTTTTEIENFPGAWSSETKKGMMGPDLMSLMQKQAEHFGAKTKMENVDKLEVLDNGKFKIVTAVGENIFDGVIIATGASARYLGLPGEEKYVGKGYHSCATCDGFFYRDKEIAIVGGGDSAMEEANFLTRFAKKVYLLHRREEFRASKIMLQRVKDNPKIEIMTNTVVDEIVGQDELEKLKIKNTQTGEISDLAVSGLFVAIGHIPNSKFTGNLFDKDASGYLIPQGKMHSEMRTSKYQMATKVPGVFVAGDIEDTEYRQAITAAAGGCRAAMELEKWLEEA